MRAETARKVIVALAAVAMLIATGCGASKDEAKSGGTATTEVSSATPPGTAEVDRITWALYRDATSVDPITIGDYPENTVGALLCETLFKQSPDGEVGPGLATEVAYPDPKTMVLTLRDDVTFWDGSPMTAEDVVYSIERQRNPKLAGFWGAYVSSIDTVEATGPNEVTLKLTQPDQTLEGVLSFAPGMVVSKKYVEEKGEKYGTPAGGAMCTGAYKLGPWKTGGALTVERNDAYWDDSVKPKVRQIDFRGVPDEAALTSGLLSGEIDGAYPEALSTLEQVRKSGKVDVYEGPNVGIAAMIVNPKGPLGDPRVRKALSMAIDRDGLVSSVYKNTGQAAKALATPGTWGYERDTFQSAWDELPDLNGDVEEAKKLVEEAGATGEEIKLGTSNELSSIAAFANAARNAATKIGLKPKLVSTSAANYFNYFIDPKARAKVDGYFTANWVNWPDPGVMYDAVMKSYYGHKDPEATKLLAEWRTTTDPAKRAEIVTEVQKKLTEALVWIPFVAPNKVLVLNSDLSGAVASSSQMFAPWANELGGTGG